MKEIEEVRGNKVEQPMAMTSGAERARLIAWMILLATLASFLLPFAPILGVFADWQVIFVIQAVILLLLVKTKWFVSEDHAAQMLIKRSMQLGLASFFLISLLS